MVTGWIYDDKYLDETFNYNDLEKDYIQKQAKEGTSPSDLKSQLDDAHKI